MSDSDRTDHGAEPAPTVDVSQGMQYDVDIALCIDATASMYPVLDAVKERALQLPNDLHEEMNRKGKNVRNLRIRVIAYRDIYCDATPFQVSDFFDLPAQQSAFQSFLATVTADGGGDEPESGLEAVALAMRSDWANSATKTRHLVVVFTDASSHPIESNSGRVPALYADQIPSSMDDLINLWGGSQVSKLSPKSRRMLLLAPEASPWAELAEDWEEVIHFPSQAGAGLADFEYSEILDLISQSV